MSKSNVLPDNYTVEQYCDALLFDVCEKKIFQKVDDFEAKRFKKRFGVESVINLSDNQRGFLVFMIIDMAGRTAEDLKSLLISQPEAKYKSVSHYVNFGEMYISPIFVNNVSEERLYTQIEYLNDGENSFDLLVKTGDVILISEEMKKQIKSIIAMKPSFEKKRLEQEFMKTHRIENQSFENILSSYFQESLNN